MSILIRNKSICSICNKKIDVGAPVFAVPALISNELDPLFEYNDGVFHYACICNQPFFERVCSIISLWEERSSNKISFITGRKIAEPEDFFAFPYFGDQEEFKKINFCVCVKTELSTWFELPRLLKHLSHLELTGEWRSKLLHELIIELNRLLFRKVIFNKANSCKVHSVGC